LFFSSQIKLNKLALISGGPLIYLSRAAARGRKQSKPGFNHHYARSLHSRSIYTLSSPSSRPHHQAYHLSSIDHLRLLDSVQLLISISRLLQ
jgi:hypothetical protein